MTDLDAVAALVADARAHGHQSVDCAALERLVAERQQIHLHLRRMVIHPLE